MLKYNLCLIRQGTRILLLNREKAAWMGCWNGVGGKMEKNESPRASALREIAEETGIEPADVSFKGLITWTANGQGFGGLYVYAVNMPEDHDYPTPLKTSEGILDWKEIDWILHPDNLGVASNIPICVEKMVHEEGRCYHHHSIFAGHRMVDQISSLMDPGLEEDEERRIAYLRTFSEECLSGGRK